MAAAAEDINRWLSHSPASSVSNGYYGMPTGSDLPKLPPSVTPAPALLVWSLATLHLQRPLSVLVEADDAAYIARCPDLPQLYGYGESEHEAVESLRREIESLWADLQEDAEFSDEFLAVKQILARFIGG